MFKKEQLENMKVAELKSICKEKGIPHYHGKSCFRKAEMVEAILRAEKSVEETESAKEENKIENQNNADVTEKVEKKAASVEVDMEQKMAYIESIKIGTLVAFRLSNGKVKSAKVMKKSTKNRKLKLETNYGAEYIASYDDIIWVRTGKRWPRGVYNLLKGITNEGRK